MVIIFPEAYTYRAQQDWVKLGLYSPAGGVKLNTSHTLNPYWIAWGGGGPDMNSAQLSLPVVNCGSDRVVEYFHIVVNSYRSQIPVSMHIFVKMLPSLEIMTGT